MSRPGGSGTEKTCVEVITNLTSLRPASCPYLVFLMLEQLPWDLSEWEGTLTETDFRPSKRNPLNVG
jgi:hypothetical protein